MDTAAGCGRRPGALESQGAQHYCLTGIICVRKQKPQSVFRLSQIELSETEWQAARCWYGRWKRVRHPVGE